MRADRSVHVARPRSHAVSGHGDSHAPIPPYGVPISARFGEVEILPIEDFSLFRFCWFR